MPSPRQQLTGTVVTVPVSHAAWIVGFVPGCVTTPAARDAVLTKVLPTSGLPSPARSGRGPPVVQFILRTATRAKRYRFGPFSFSAKGMAMSAPAGTTSIDQTWLRDLRARLAHEHAEQTARLTELTADTGDPGEAHTQAALLAAARQSIEQLAGALQRIDDGRYGTCDSCAGVIPPERLEVIPHARRCVPCQQKHGA